MQVIRFRTMKLPSRRLHIVSVIWFNQIHPALPYSKVAQRSWGGGAAENGEG